MSQLGQSRQFSEVRATSALPLIADVRCEDQKVRRVPILLQKSFWGGERKFLEPPTRRCEGPYRFIQSRSRTSVIGAFRVRTPPSRRERSELADDGRLSYRPKCRKVI